MKAKVFGECLGLVVRDVENWLDSRDDIDVCRVDAHFHSQPTSYGGWPYVVIVIYYEPHSD